MNINENRWSINELLVRYELEPELKDIFVEGSFDREILTHHVSGKNSHQTFYEIDVVDVPLTILESYGLTSGNKQRAIALSMELTKVPSSAHVFCLVDRDLDHWFTEVSNSARLRWSSFCSIEGHFLNSEIVRDVTITTSRAKISNFEVFFESLLETLRQIFSLRLADRDLGLNMSWVSIKKYLSTESSKITFDLEKYVLAVLNKNSKMGKINEFSTSAKSWKHKLSCDVRLAFHGHDYTELLAWGISKFNGQKEFSTQEAVQRLFVLISRSTSSLSLDFQ